MQLQPPGHGECASQRRASIGGHRSYGMSSPWRYLTQQSEQLRLSRPEELHQEFALVLIDGEEITGASNVVRDLCAFTQS